jgi:hypothetical protein
MIYVVAQFEIVDCGTGEVSLANARPNGKLLGRPPLRKLTRTEVPSLKRQRVRDKIPFRTLARDFGVSVWTAHRLCAVRSAKV